MGPKRKIAERHKLLLRVNEVALTNSTPEGVFQGTGKALKSIVPMIGQA
jgi:hypothetical protein